jgi:hypothetical protein
MRKRWLLRSLLVPCAVGLLLLSGCGSDTPEAPAVTVSELAGTWLSGCEPETGGSGPSAVESRLTAVSLTAAGDITFHEYEWNSTDACDNQPAWFQRNVGTLSIPGGNVTTTFGTAAKVDMAATLSELTLFDPTLVSNYNTDTAYGFNDWAQGVAKNITNLGYSGAAEPSTMKTLMMRSGETLFVGDDQVLGADGYPTQVRPEVSRVPTVAVTAAAATGEWVGECRQESRTEYSSAIQSAVEWVEITTTQVTITTTYYATTFCGQTTGPAPALPARELREAITFDYSVSGTTNLLTERGLATGLDLTMVNYNITPLSANAASTLNTAVAFNISIWAVDTPFDVVPGGVDYDGTTPLALAMKVAALVRGDRFYARGGDPWQDIPYQSPGGVGYPLTVGTEPLLRNYTSLSLADIAGNWYEPCSGGEGWWTSATFISGSTATRQEWFYSDGTTCAGTANPSGPTTYSLTVQDPVSTDRGTAYQVQLAWSGNYTMCALLMRAGDRLMAGDSQDAAAGVDGACVPGDYNVEVGDSFSSLETTPVTTLPLGTYRGLCRAETTSSWVDYITFHGNAMSGSTVNYAPATNCTGTISTHDRFSGVITFGATVAVTEGAATKISVVDETGASMLQIVKWMDDLVWTGDDMGPLSGGYPTQMIPGHDLRRIY